LIIEIENDFTLTTNGNKWEYFKFKTRENSIRFGKQLMPVKLMPVVIHRKLQEDVDKLRSLQTKLDHLYL